MDDHSTNADPLATRVIPASSVSEHSDRSELETSPYIRSDTGSRSDRLEVRCPNCHAPTDVAVDSALTDLVCSSCGSQFSLIDDNAASRQAPSLASLGRFELIARVGIGAFGSVWKARDKQLDRTVAIKIPRQSAMSAAEQEQFFREARTAAQLRHPNIVSVHEVGRDGDSLYIVSDFVRGVTLGDWLTGQHLTSREAAELCAKIAAALHHAHEQGVVHRDLKPANIMIDDAGEPHLMDFGLARREVGEITVTTDGQLLGTPAYMSPEQAAGESHSADRRSDVYSLGVILFQLLTGELPFRGNSRMVLHQVINDEPPSPRKLNANVKKDLETITLKCLDKKPSNRYSTAEVLAEDLHHSLAGKPIQARPISGLERAARWIMRNRSVAALALCVVIALGGGAVVSAFYAMSASRQAAIAIARKNDADASRLDSQKAKEHVESLLAAQYTANGVNDINESRTNDAVLWFAEALKHKDQTKAFPRSMQLSATLNQCPQLIGVWKHDARVNSAAFSRDGKYIVSASNDKTARVWSVERDSPLAIYPHKAEVFCASFNKEGTTVLTASADGTAGLWNVASRQLAYALPHRSSVFDASYQSDDAHVVTLDQTPAITSWDIKSRKQVFQKQGEGCRIATISSSKDRTFVAVSAGQTVEVWDPLTQKLLSTLRVPSSSDGDEDSVVELKFDDAGANLAIISGAGSVSVYSLATFQPVANLTHEGCTSVYFSGDGKRIATVAGHEWFETSEVRIWEIPSGIPVGKPLTHTAYVTSVAFSPDSSQLATSSTDQAVRVWSLRHLSVIHELYHRGHVMQATFSPSGRYLLIAGGVADGGHVALWNLESVSAKVLDNSSPIDAAELESTGRHVLCVNADGTAQLWNCETGQRVQLRHLSSPIKQAALSPDAKRVITSCRDGQIRVWDASTGVATDEFRAGGELQDTCFANIADPLMCFIKREDRNTSIRVQSISKKQHATTNDLPVQIGSSRFNQDGSLVLAFGQSPIALLWNWNDGGRITTLKHDPKTRGILDAEFNTSRKMVATASSEWTGQGRVQLWSTETGEQIGPPLKSNGYVMSVAISHDGMRVAAGSRDHTASVWDTASGQLLFAPLPHVAVVSYVEFSRDGRILLTVSGDSARLWDVVGGTLIARYRHHQKIGTASLNSEGDSLLVTAGDQAFVYKLKSLNDDEDLLVAMAQFISGKKVDDRGNLIELSVSGLVTLWNQLRLKSPNQFVARPDLVVGASD